MKRVVLLLGILLSLMFTGCGGGGDTTAVSQAESSLAVIADYANGSGVKPTVEDYHNVGVSSVDAETLDDVNFLIAGLSYEEVDSQGEVKEVLKAREEALALIMAYARSGGKTLPSPDPDTYRAVGIKGVNAGNVAQLNALIAGKNEAEVDTGLEIDAIFRSVFDTIKPVITLRGEATVTVTKGESYTDAGATASDDRDGDITNSIVTNDPVDSNTVGTYTVTYNVSDTAGNAADEVVRTVNVTEASGSAPAAPSGISGWSETQEGIRIGWNDNSDNEGGFRIYDSDNNIVADKIAENTIAHTITGLNCDTLYSVYVVAYNEYGESGKSDIKSFRTEACEDDDPDTIKPVITLRGEATVTVTKGESYTDAGAIASDDRDGDITSSIVINDPVDSNIVGTYTVTYNVSDTAGNAADQVSRTVNVIEAEGSVPAAPTAFNKDVSYQYGGRMSWIDHATNEKGFRIYDIYNKLMADNISPQEGEGEYQYYTIAGLECDKLYPNFYIVAYNDYGESNKSNEITLRTELCDNILPTAEASASPITVDLDEDESVTFSCEGSDEDGTIEKYRWLVGHTEVATGATFTTNDFSVGENTYTCEVEDDRKGIGRDDVTITATSDQPTSYATATPDSIMTEERSTLECKGNSTYEGGIKGYTWYKNATEVSSKQTYNTPVTLPEGNYTYTCTVTYNDDQTASDDVNLTVKALDADLERIEELVLDFESYEVGDYTDKLNDDTSPVYYAISDGYSLDIEYAKIIDRGDENGKAFCIKGKASGKKWDRTLIFNIPGLDPEHPLNLAGELDFDFEYKETRKESLNATLWINLYDHQEYLNGKSSSTNSGGRLLFNLDPGTWQQGIVDNFNYAFGIDNPNIAGDLYGIQTKDTSVEIKNLALKISHGTENEAEETFDFCIDNIRLSGTQMKPDVFDNEYGSEGGYKRWSEYTDRIGYVYGDIVSDRDSLKVPTCSDDLSVKRDYQCHKLAALKDFIDDKIKAMDDTKASNAGAFMSKDVRRVQAAISRYKATYNVFNAPPAHDEIIAYRVPAMKRGRLDGYTFPLEYSTLADAPYELTMAKGEYRSIAILLDPGADINKELTFGNTAFTQDGEESSVTLDKYIAPVWYQAGKDDSNSDHLEFEFYNNEEGTAWLTQELLLKNEKLIKIVRDANEKNMIYYEGKNYLYTIKKDMTTTETFRDDWGQVPGYVKISNPYADETFGPYDITKVIDGVEKRVGTRYNLTADDDDLLIFDDALSIQSFTLHDEYKLLWGIIHVAKDAKTGLNQATIEIKEGDTLIKQIPLKITVLGYELSESKLDYGIYYHGKYESGTPPSVQAIPNTINKTREQQYKDLEDMYAHGLRHPFVELETGRAGYLMDDLEAIGYPNDKFFSWDGNLFARPVTDPQKIYDLQQVMEGHDYFTDAQLYIGVVDEASTSQISDIKRYIRDVLRGDEWKDKIHVKTWGGVFKSAAELLADGGYLDAPVVSGGLSSWTIPYQLELFTQAEEDEKGNWTDAATVYKYGDPQTGVEDPEVYRRNYGVTMWQEGFTGGGMDYAWQKQYGFFWNDFDIAYTFEKNHREEAFTYPTTGLVEGGKGMVSTIQWEGYRAAITDSRYISTLYDRAGEANKEEIDRFIRDDLDTSEGSDLDAVRQQIIDKINSY